jgi:hypothetical protein
MATHHIPCLDPASSALAEDDAVSLPPRFASGPEEPEPEFIRLPIDHIPSLLRGDSDDVLTITGFLVRTIATGAGDDDVTLHARHVEEVALGAGDDHLFLGAANAVTRQGRGTEVSTLDLGEGDNTVTGSGYAHDVLAGSGDDRVRLADANTMDLGGGDNTVDVGRVGSILTGAGDDTVTIGLLDAFVDGRGEIWTGAGDDRIEIDDVFAHRGHSFATVDAGEGDDTIIATGGSLFGGDGDDTFLVDLTQHLTSRTAGGGTVPEAIDGGAGFDTLTIEVGSRDNAGNRLLQAMLEDFAADGEAELWGGPVSGIETIDILAGGTHVASYDAGEILA